MERAALVTGGTRGIGKSISVRLHDVGYNVVASYANDDTAAKEFNRKTGIPVVRFDVGDWKSTQIGLERAQEIVGNIDVLINNAGITRDKSLHKMSDRNWQEVIQVDLNSCFNTCKCLINSMREKRYGRIVNISSVNAQKGQLGQTNYSAAKAGIIGFTKALALENANKGITVNAVAPGYIDTDMVRSISEQTLNNIIAEIPVGRLGRPDEVARVVEFLVSDDSEFITGSTISINGGQYMI